MSAKVISLLVFFFSFTTASYCQSLSKEKDTAKSKNLVFPLLLEKEKRYRGNPLATYASLIELEKEYKASPFSVVYDEIRYNFEQFLGFPESGKKAMNLTQFKTRWDTVRNFTWSSWSAHPAIEVIKDEAKKTRIIVWGEEHHLPQTRALLQNVVQELWKLGYRYLAAETFAEGISDSTLKWVNYHTGYYTADPVFASAINSAIKLGYKLIDYDTKETSSSDPSFRDIRQAENIINQVFRKDTNAKVFVIAGRGHASEKISSNGWKPMASVLKNLTGIDPFTIYAPTMSERLLAQDEHPLYKEATSKNLFEGITIFRNRDNGSYLGTESFDAYVFFPRAKIIQGRPDWMFTTLNRKAVLHPFKKFTVNKEMLLVQAFLVDQPFSSIPADQFIIENSDRNKIFALSPGKYRVRIIDRNDNTIAVKNLRVK